MKYKENWDETKEKWSNYWKHKNTGRPLMCVIARKEEIEDLAVVKNFEAGVKDIICQGGLYALPDDLKWGEDMHSKYQDPEKIVSRYRHFCETHEFLAESFPNLNLDFGPGSLAAYLGSDIGFKEDTVWFLPCFENEDDWTDIPPLTLDPENPWFKKHIELYRRCRELVGDDFPICIPDMMENIDVLASLRDINNLMYDLAIDPDDIKSRVNEVTAAYKTALNSFYDIVKYENGGSAYTVFQIWGPGRCVKLQCDAGAMISPEMFRDTVLDSLKKQTGYADQVLYHLDGPENIRHLDALLEIDGIDAIQWTSGDAGPDGTLPEWDEIYDKTRRAGKSLWIKVYSGEYDDWIKNVDRIVQKYGSHSLFLMFPEMSLEQAKKLIAYADEHWSDVPGWFS